MLNKNDVSTGSKRTSVQPLWLALVAFHVSLESFHQHNCSTGDLLLEKPFHGGTHHRESGR
jgi:hypothetical protein